MGNLCPQGVCPWDNSNNDEPLQDYDPKNDPICVHNTARSILNSVNAAELMEDLKCDPISNSSKSTQCTFTFNPQNYQQRSGSFGSDQDSKYSMIGLGFIAFSIILSLFLFYCFWYRKLPSKEKSEKRGSISMHSSRKSLSKHKSKGSIKSKRSSVVRRKSSKRSSKKT